MPIINSIKGANCPDGAAVARILGTVRKGRSGHDHWAIVTDRQHRIQRVYSARSLEQLADRLARSRLGGRCFAIASVDGREGSEDALVAEWRLKRIAERSDSCFFAWVHVELDAVNASQASAAA